MKQKLLNSFKLRAVMLVAILCAGFTSAWADDVKDVITASDLAATSTTYTDFSNVSKTSDAVYAGNSANNSGNIQMRSKNSNSGIVSTVSGGTVKSVIITVGSGSNTIDVYGSNTAYTAASDLYDTNTQGTKIGSLTATGTITFSGDYKYVGIRSNSGAIYLSSIEIVWETSGGGGTPTPSTYTVTYDANGGTGTMTDSNSPYEEDDEVTLLANAFTAPDGKVWNSWTVKDASDNAITVSNGKFTMPASNVTVSAQWVDDPNAPQYEWVETSLANLTSSDVFVIVGTVSNSNYSMSNNSTSNPAASSVTIESGKITSAVSDNIKWNISGNATDGYTFYPNGSTTTWLYCNTTANSGSNTNLRVGTGTNPRKLFVADGTTLKTKDSNTARYWNVYSSGPDWRGYTSNSTSTTVKFYKRQVASTDPSISASDPEELAYDATSGEFVYSITNPTSATLTATTNSDWITNVAVDGTNSKVTFSTTANPNTTQRTGTITLSYTGADNKEVTITQAAAPVIYTTIPSLFDAATSTEAEVKVTFNNWVVSGVSTNGKNVFVTDNAGNGFVIYSSSDQSNTYAVGNILSGQAITCNLVKYNGFAEIIDLDASDLTITEGGTVTTSNVIMADLAGVNTGALVSYQSLTCSIDNNKYYLTDGTTTIQVYNALFAFDALEAGKTYNITGVYQQYNATKEILPRSAADIVEVVSTEPSITIAETSVNVSETGNNGTINITYANLDVDDMSDFDIQYYDAQGQELSSGSEPDWIQVLVAEQDPQVGEGYVVSYTIDENTDTEERSAYFKVFALGDEAFVYSNLVTATQAGMPTYKVLALTDMSGNYQAVSSDAGSKEGALAAVEVDMVNNKVITSNEKLMWAVQENNGTYTFKNKATNEYLNYNYNSANLSTGSTASEWSFGSTKDGYSDSWTIMDNGTKRTIMYRDEYEFKNYSVNNFGKSGYSSSSLASYDYTDGYTRTVTGGNWGTICLPKAVAASDFSGVTFYTITGKKMSNGSLEYITASPVTNLQAGYAYLFKADAEATKMIAAYTGDAVDAPVTVETSGTGLQGSFTQTAIPVGGYVLSSGVLYYVDQANFAYSGQNRAYIDLTNVSEIGSGQVKGVCLFADGVDGVNTMKNEELDSVIFNLAGQRMSKPVKGVNIVNGKKVLVK